MTIEAILVARSGSKCELCSSTVDLIVYDVEPNSGPSADSSALICSSCLDKFSAPDLDLKHWYCLNESMWSQFPAVQVLAYRVLKRFGENSWAQDLLGQLYLDEESKTWADASVVDEPQSLLVVDSNGTPLQTGDTVTLIKDLNVKGANFTAKRGTTVKNILLTDDAKLVEGRINGTQIVLVAAYLKKA